jgi:L-alanine-DL-glutamate epimerase-like enolase superfamily enzyme
VSIARLEAFLLQDRFTFVRVESSEGAVGWGEAAFYGTASTTEIANGLAAHLVGRDPMNVSAIWRDLFLVGYPVGEAVLRGYRVGNTGAWMAAMSAFDIALHDLQGRMLGVPVHALLGGRLRDRIPVYGSLMRSKRTPAEEAERVQDLLDQGYRAVKVHTGAPWSFGEGADNTVARVAAIREHCGGRDVFDLFVDVNQSYSIVEAIRIGRALEALEVGHLEEPLAPWDLDGYSRLQAALDLPIAAGEQECNIWQFRDLLTRANVDVIQPNITACGGFTQGMKIAALAEAFSRPIMCNNTDPSLMTAAQVQFTAAAPTATLPMEYYGERAHPMRDRLPKLVTAPVVTDGCLSVSDAPGLGVEVDEEAVRSTGVQVRV